MVSWRGPSSICYLLSEIPRLELLAPKNTMRAARFDFSSCRPSTIELSDAGSMEVGD